MFEWNVEDLMLLNQGRGWLEFNMRSIIKKIYNCESDMTREEKIAFVDKMQDNKLSYILALSEKFEKDKEDMPTDNCGNVKTVSLKAWIKRNDKRNLIDNSYQYGSIRFMGERNIQYINRKGGRYDIYEDYVDEIFHRQLKECENLEHKYFLEHDEYSVLKQKFRDRNYGTTFGINICDCSDGNIFVYDTNDSNKRRKITIEELKYLLEKYEELDELVRKITAETNIRY